MAPRHRRRNAAVIAAIGVVVAGPIYQVVDGNQWGVWLLAWLYSFGIVSIGVGLHPVLGKWTTPTLTALFVMLNVTSSGGVFPASLLPPLFAGTQHLLERRGLARRRTVAPLLPWPRIRLRRAAPRALGHRGNRPRRGDPLWSTRKRRLADDTISVTEEEEVIAA